MVDGNNKLNIILGVICVAFVIAIVYIISYRNNVESANVYFKINATYIANGNNENPLGLKLDDEYNDICLFNSELNTINNDNINKYYYYDSISSNYSRNFKNYISVENFTNNIGRYINYDLNGNEFYHVWKKIETPYKVIPSILMGEYWLEIALEEHKYLIEYSETDNRTYFIIFKED